MSGLCGIVDFAASRIEPEDLFRMVEAASYRGPAGVASHFSGPAGLAHLALQAGDRPAFDPRRQLCVLFDGRLDNRPELIARLAPAGGPDASDTDLVLAAYLEWGEACADHLLGDFAFAVWDAPQRRLLCAVDPLGMKPLHYAFVGSLVCFASDAVQVLHHPTVPDDYNEREIAAYLACRCEDPEQSFFAAVHKLAPGHRLMATGQGLRVERYWAPRPTEIRYRREEDYAVHFREIFQRAVTDRLRTEGNSVGIAMSGGLDSCSVAAVAQRSNAGKALHAYTFTFDRLAGCDERSYSRAMTEELGLSVEPVAAESLWSLESQAPLPHSPDTPFVGWRTCYQEILRRMAARGSRVLLMGHGGDDLLRGSPLIYAERLRRGDLAAVGEVARHARDRSESVLRSLYRQFARPHLPAGVHNLLYRIAGRRERPLPAWIQPDFTRRALVDRPAEHAGFASPARQETYTHLVGNPWYWRLANWHDRNATAFGIEVRHPFLDRRLFEYVLAIPGEQLFRLGRSKQLLRRSMEGVLPERIRLRKGKTSFVSFLDFALRKRAAGEIQELLREPRAAALGFVDGELLRSAYLDFMDGGTDGSRRALWYAITLEIWLRRCEVIRRDSRRVRQLVHAAA